MNAINESAIKKLQLLITVVDKQKAEFYQDVLSQYEINCQMILSGKGTAQSEIVDLLGLNIHKAVLFSIVREDNAAPAIECLEEKFSTIRGGKGIAFVVPMSSVIGVNLYQFLSNNKQGREETL